MCSSPRVGGFRTQVCDTNWDNQDAEVVCRELGLPHGRYIRCYRSDNSIIPWLHSPAFCFHYNIYMHTANARSIVYGGGRVIISYDNVNCVGTESRLADCQNQIVSSNRVCAGYAGVLCQSEYCSWSIKMTCCMICS